VLIQGLGGIILAAGLYFTARTFQLTRRGQVTDRFARSIGLLGESGPNKTDVRVGAVYSLEQIAIDEADLTRPIAEVLTAFVRNHATRKPKASWRFTLKAKDRRLAADDSPMTRLRSRLPDVQAALDVLCRRDLLLPRGVILNFNATDLSHAHLEDARLQKATFFGADLSHAWCLRANFEEARLDDALLVGANLNLATLRRASLHGTDLRCTENIRTATMTGAVANKNTKWPAGFDWRAAGVMCER
jgi:Pentapeptide repeats (8 copies)